jgi:hypothetical protein
LIKFVKIGGYAKRDDITYEAMSSACL